MQQANYSIKALSAETGVSPYTIRAWEKRYSALAPARTPTNRRRYTTNDVKRLKLLNQGVDAGHTISAIANLTNEELESLVEAGPGRTKVDTSEAVEHCLEYVAKLDSLSLERTLGALIKDLSVLDFARLVVTPFARRVGQGWEDGILTIAQEHLATAAVRASLDKLRSSFTPLTRAYTCVATTPTGQQHEIGALVSATLAAAYRWRSIYLGPNVPSLEIGDTCRMTRADALAISITVGESETLRTEIEEIARHLPESVKVFVGGQAGGQIESACIAHGWTIVTDFTQLTEFFENYQREP